MSTERSFARCGPVHFQPLEDELAPVASFLRGRLLNAGCGNRDLRPWLAGIGVGEMTTYLHECPHDFRRFTREGHVALGEGAGLKAVAVNPVHSAAQTIGRILWAIAQEKGRLWRVLAWPLVFIWTHFSTRTDPALQRNANTYQVVFQRP